MFSIFQQGQNRCSGLNCKSSSGHVGCPPAHHALVQVGLDDIRVHILHIQDMKLGFHSIQHTLAIKHPLLEIRRLLEKLELCGNLSKFPLFVEMGVSHS